MIRSIFPAITLMVMLACAAIAGDITSDLRTAFGDNGADSISAALDAARESGIPVVTLKNKVREGMAKGRKCREILDAISIRTDCIVQVEKNNAGVLPDHYAKQVYLLEKERYGVPAEKHISDNDHVPVSKTESEKQRQPGDAIVRKNAPSSAIRVEPLAGKENQWKQDSSGKAASMASGAKEHRADENEKRLEAMMEKSEKKAEKNERNFEKKIEKQERKSR
jgi:hypothetical protein